MRFCSHCGLPVRGRGYPLEHGGNRHVFCCAGCRIAWQALNLPGTDTERRMDEEIAAYAPRHKIGKGGDTDEWEFSLEGMTCRACVPIVRKILEKTAGVKQSRVNFVTGRAVVSYDPGLVSRDLLKKRLFGYGYRVIEGRERFDEDTATLLRLSLGLFLSMNVMLLSFPEYVGGFAPEEESLIPWLRFGMLTLTIPVLLWTARPIFLRARASIAALRPDVNFLVAVGTLSSFGYSLYGTVTNGPHVYYETAAFLPAMIVLGRALEERAGRKAREALLELTDIVPQRATVIRNGIEDSRPPESLVAGDVIIVGAQHAAPLQGVERAPCDGIIREGGILVDETMLTGEPAPRWRGTGDVVRAGAAILAGEARIEVSAPLEDSLLGTIVSSVERAELFRGARQAVLDRVVTAMVPAVILLGFIAGAYAIAIHAGMEAALLRGLAVILFACPCALGIAAPLARAAAIGRAAQMGIAVRDAESLAVGGEPTAIIFDKTGTLTKGAPILEHVQVAPDCGMNENDIIALAASIDRGSSHPFASALSRAAESRGISMADAADVTDKPGFGRCGKIGTLTYLLGNERFMQSESATIPVWALGTAKDLSEKGRSVSYLAKGDGRVFIIIGLFGFADELRPEAPKVIGELKKVGVRPILATGDHSGAAGIVAAQCGISEVFAGLVPDDKRDLVVRLKNEGNVVWAVGDGVNDAPLLAVAALGIAMGRGTKLASESAHLTLVAGQLDRLPRIIELSRALAKKEKQNIAWAIMYNAAGLPLAFFGLLKPVFSAIAMTVSSLSVVLNSLRLDNIKGKEGTTDEHR